MESQRHQNRRRRTRFRSLVLNWLGIAICWGALVYLQVSAQAASSRGALEACRRASALGTGVRCDPLSHPGGGILEGMLGWQVLLTTVVLVLVGIVNTRKKLPVPASPGLLTKSRPHDPRVVWPIWEEAERPTHPHPTGQPDRSDDQGTGEENRPSEAPNRHLGLRRFRVPPTYRRTVIDSPGDRRDPAA